MTTAIDTNIISALWNEDDALNRTAQRALDAASGGGRLVISGLVYAELLAAPGRTDTFLDKFCEEGSWDRHGMVDKNTQVAGQVKAGTVVTVDYQPMDGGQNLCVRVAPQNS